MGEPSILTGVQIAAGYVLTVVAMCALAGFTVCMWQAFAARDPRDTNQNIAASITLLIITMVTGVLGRTLLLPVWP